MNVENTALIVEHITGADPLKNSRQRGVIMARTLLVNALLYSGYTEQRAADSLGFGHPNIHHHRQKLRDALAYNNDPDLVTYWTKLKKILDL